MDRAPRRPPVGSFAKGASAHRFFVEPSILVGETVVLSGPLAHQLSRVLRLRPGERIILLDGEGQECEAEVEALQAHQAQVRILARRPAAGEPRHQVTLYQALLKGPRFEWVLQKGTELGIAAFVPILTSRCVAVPQRPEAKLARWQAIVREAAEQAGRGRLPRVAAPLPFAAACAGVKEERAFLAWEGERDIGLRQALAGLEGADGVSWALFIGPEGGFSAEEVALAQGYGIRPVSLGPRTLRAETAALAAAAALFFALGEWG